MSDATAQEILGSLCAPKKKILWDLICENLFSLSPGHAHVVVAQQPVAAAPKPHGALNGLVQVEVPARRYYGPDYSPWTCRLRFSTCLQFWLSSQQRKVRGTLPEVCKGLGDEWRSDMSDSSIINLCLIHGLKVLRRIEPSKSAAELWLKKDYSLAKMAQEIWVCEKESVTKWKGDILTYKSHLKDKITKNAEPKPNQKRS